MISPSEATIPAEALVEIDVDDLDLPEFADTADEAEALLQMNRVLTVLGQVEREQAANEAEYTELIRFYRERHEARQQKLASRITYLTDLLAQWYRAHPPTSGKSRKLLAGKVGMRTTPARRTVTDEEALLAWAKAHAPALVETKITERVPAKAVQELPTDPPGVQAVPARETFYAKAG